MPKYWIAYFVLIFSSMFLSVNGEAREQQPSVYSVRGYSLGVINSGNLFCYEINGDNKWQRCSDWTPVPIPSDAVLVDANSRRVMLARKEKVRYFDEEGRLNGSCSHDFPSELNSDSQIFRSSNSTECEIFVRDGDYFYIYGPEKTSKEKASKIPFTCEAIDKSLRVFWYDVKWRVAVVKDNSVQVYRIYRVDDSNRLSCLAEPEKTLKFDNLQDEISIIGSGIVAARNGKVVDFFSFDLKAKDWKKARNPVYENNEIPRFVFPGSALKN